MTDAEALDFVEKRVADIQRVAPLISSRRERSEYYYQTLRDLLVFLRGVRRPYPPPPSNSDKESSRLHLAARLVTLAQALLEKGG